MRTKWANRGRRGEGGYDLRNAIKPTLSMAARARFVSPALPLAALGLPLSVYLPEYYSSHVGLDLAQVGLAFLIVRSIDIVFDPVVGVLLDRTRTRFGQCRPWLLTGSIFIVLGTPWLFWTGPGGSLAGLIAALLIVYFGHSMAVIAHSAWASRLSDDYNARSRTWGWMQVAGTLGSFLIISLPAMSRFFDALRAMPPVHVMGVLMIVLIPLTCALALIRQPEPAVAAVAHTGRGQTLADYIALLRIPDIRRIIVADALIALGQGMSAVLFIFFWQAGRGYAPADVGLMITSYMLGGLLGVPIWTRAAEKVGKHRALNIGLLGYVLIIPAAALLPPDNLVPVMGLQLLLGISFAAGSFLLRAMTADSNDLARLELGKDHMGQLFALLASTQKLGSAVSVGLAYGLLDWFGFQARAAGGNSPDALSALSLLYFAAPGGLMLLAIAALARYRLDRRRHAEIRAALADGGKRSV